MHTDTLIYQLFSHRPDLFLELVGDARPAEGYVMTSPEIKTADLTPDGVIKTNNESDRVYIVEFQMQKDADIYYRLVAEGQLWERENPTYKDVQYVVVFAKRSCEPPRRPVEQGLIDAGKIMVIYLEEWLLADESAHSALQLVQLFFSKQNMNTDVDLLRTLFANKTLAENAFFTEYCIALMGVKYKDLTKIKLNELLAMVLHKKLDYSETVWGREIAAEAMLKGKQEGLLKGKQDEKRQTAKQMLRLGLDLTTIAQCTGLTISEIQALR